MYSLSARISFFLGSPVHFSWFQISSLPRDRREMLSLWLTWWRDLLLFYGARQEHMVNSDRKVELTRLSRQSTLSQVKTVLNALQETVAQLDANVNARLALEGLLLRLPRWQPRPEGSEAE